MKNIFIITFLFIACAVKAQKVQEIASKNIDEAIPLFEQIADFKNTDNVKLIGIGDVGELVKETKKFNTAFSAYLITKKNYRNIVLRTDDWLLRPLNTYLTTDVPADDARTDSLIKSIFSGRHKFENREFSSFIKWIKAYNLAHPADVVNIFGVAPNTPIPPAYFLAIYVIPLDETNGLKLSEKWSNVAPSDSAAYADIKTWMVSVNKTRLSAVDQALLLRCGEDLVHNNFVLKIESPNQKFPAKAINDVSRYIAGQILKKLSKKTIHYGLNTEVVKANLETNFTADNAPYLSAGKFLSDALKENYYVFITDFAGTAKLPVADLSAQKMDVEQFTGSARAKALFGKKDYIDRKKDKDALKGYTPMLLPYIKGQFTNAIAEPDSYAADGLFLFSDLSEIDLNY
ncbi:hypothetical protein [Mucilaginibacter flavus]|uniref:hypothetical protein n=1 Tax=Mucilaginibacter flavus TaxID=931504 RepID=UPI0025B4020A|nr:hypothetical protein [Mucilaginibacter flavus]MDN3582069.1 hypothetical protein [Mucilaginibacter flavus]